MTVRSVYLSPLQGFDSLFSGQVFASTFVLEHDLEGLLEWGFPSFFSEQVFASFFAAQHDLEGLLEWGFPSFFSEQAFASFFAAQHDFTCLLWQALTCAACGHGLDLLAPGSLQLVSINTAIDSRVARATNIIRGFDAFRFILVILKFNKFTFHNHPPGRLSRKSTVCYYTISIVMVFENLRFILIFPGFDGFLST